MNIALFDGKKHCAVYDNCVPIILKPLRNRYGNLLIRTQW